MAEDRSVPGDSIDDIVEELRRCNPVDIEALPCSRSTEAMTALERILDSGDEPDITEPESKPEPKPESKPEPKPESKPEPKPESEPEPKPDKSSPSPAAGDPVGEKGRRRVQRRGGS